MNAPFPIRDPANGMAEIRQHLEALLTLSGQMEPQPLLGCLEAARALWSRKALEAAIDHGAALLTALKLPMLVTAEFTPPDPDAMGSALDLAIAVLDDLDGEPDLEDDGTAEAEPDDEDDGTAEPILGAPERHPHASIWCERPIGYRTDESQASWAQGSRDDREVADEDGPIDEDELDGAGDIDSEPSIGWPEDFTAEVVPMLEASVDAEHDDVDREDDELGDDFAGELIVWLFGPNRREVAHV